MEVYFNLDFSIFRTKLRGFSIEHYLVIRTEKTKLSLRKKKYSRVSTVCTVAVCTISSMQSAWSEYFFFLWPVSESIFCKAEQV